jgi:NAD(P)-dependent dehydrogenase (short-subunit alcohol dehydrogenase family)/acyl carrier protein
VYRIDPGASEDYRALLCELRGLVRTPTVVLHCWAADGPERPVERDMELGYFSLVRLARALTAERVLHPVRLAVLTRGAFDVTGEEAVRPAATALLGPCMVLPHEYHNLACTQVDLPPVTSEPAVDRETTLLALAEALEPAAPVVALRHGRRWVRDVDPVPDLAGQTGRPPRLKERGVYVVTGGFGGIGQTVAMHFARTLAARLVLVSRRAVPDRGTRDDGTAVDPGGSRLAEQVRALEASGAEVLTVQADVADEAALAAGLALARERFGPIDGVVHAAGGAGGGAVELRDDDSMRDVLAPRVTGTEALLACLREGEADVIVLCSSLASLAAGYGQADYAAASAYLDGVAAREARRRPFVLSVNWDTWADVGMAAEADLPPDLRDAQRAMLAGALTSEQAMDALAAGLAGPSGQLHVLRAGTPAPAARAVEQLVPTVNLSAPRQRHARPDLTIAYQAPETELEQRIVEIWQECLGVDAVGVRDGFLDLGGHSLIAAQVIARVRAAFGVDVPVTALFERGSVAELATEIEELVLADVERGG